MAYATIDDLAIFAGDRYLNETDRATAEKLIEYASAIIDERFNKSEKDPADVARVILNGVVCNMVLRVMDSFKRNDDSNQSVYDGDPFASTGYFNYRGKMEPTADELASLGLSKRRTAIGTVGYQCL